MKPFVKRASGVLAAILVVAAGISTVASADTGTLSPTSGTAAINSDQTRGGSDTGITISLPVGAHCTGNNAAGYTVRSYFIGSGVTLSSVDFTATGLPLPASGAGTGTSFVSSLPRSSNGAAVAVNPNPSSPYPVVGLPQLSLYKMAGLATVPAGTYHMGFACVGPTNAVDGTNFWDTTVVIANNTGTQGTTAASFTWALSPGFAPTGATLAASAGDASATLTVVIPAATPAITSASITGNNGFSTINLNAGQILAAAAPGGLSLPVSSLTNGTTYALTLTGSNGIAPDETANANVTPQYQTLSNATAVQITNIGSTTATVSWTNAATNNPNGQTPTGYTVTLTGTGAPAPFTSAANPLNITGLTANVAYHVVVTAVYSQANPVATAPFNDFTTTSATVIVQNISVNRPSGLLVMTQRCAATPGVRHTINGLIPAQNATQAGLGFPSGIPQTDPTSVASISGGPGDNGVAPAASNTPFATTPADPTFAVTDPLAMLSGYPYPQDINGVAIAPAYPTRCTVDLGNATLLTTGPQAGQYFVATGQIDQVTIVNSQDSDPGWHVTGQMSDFQNTNLVVDALNKFSGDYLGWTPKLTWNTAPQTGISPYAMTVSANSAPAVQGTAGGLSDGDLLGSALVNHSIGIAQFDARLKLLIPAQMKNGTYHGTLTFSALNG
ncbi:MAG: fibronectin type III domain-containing protein [Actinomycetota bacterium]